MIFYFFKPLYIKEQEFVDVPLFEIKDFRLYELNKERLQTLMSGDRTRKYIDRYVVQKIDFTDSSQKYISNMRANRGLYKENIVYLDGNVSYMREDGLSFESQHVTYNKKTSLVETNDDFVAQMGKDSMSGTAIEYNTLTNKMIAKNIEVNYKLQERSQ